MNFSTNQTFKSRLLPTWILLFIAALNGLLYVFLVPPWEHNDEPGNFEYAWMFANMEGKREEWSWKNDQRMRREIAASMIEQGFFEHHPVGRPNLLDLDQEVWIGIKQTSGLPLYFLLASLPLRALRYADIVLQLYGARGLSLFLFCFTVYLSILINRELSWERKWGSHLPLFFALFPSFVDKMTAVNDDVGAVAFFTLFLWFCIRILRKGGSLGDWVGLTASVVLCVFTKRNVWVSVPIGALVIVLALLRRWRPAQWGLVGILVLLFPISVLSFDYHTSAFFYGFTNRQLSRVIRSESAIAGERVVLLAPGYHLMYQSLSKEKLESINSNRIRVGYWLWGNGETSTSLLKVKVNGVNAIADQAITLSSQPTLIQHTIDLPDAVEEIAIEVSVITAEEAEIYLDCLFLFPDTLASFQMLKPSDPFCQQLALGNSLVDNLIRNGSFEQTWLRLHPWLEKWVDDKFAFSITNLWSVLDAQVGIPYLRSAGIHVFNSFWGRFGWGSVPLIGKNPYFLFWIVTALVLVGNLIAVLQSKGKVAWNLMFVLIGSATLIVIMTLFRNAGNWIWYEATPNARYLLPAFLPLGLFIVNGLGTFLQILVSDQKIPSLRSFLWFGLLIVYNVWAMVSIWSYYVHIRS